MSRAARTALILAVWWGASCGGDATPPGDMSGDDACYERPAPGLTETGRLEQPRSTASAPHLGEVIVRGDIVYLSNSGDGLATYRLRDDGALELALQAPHGEVTPRCTSLALHEASSTLLCATPEGFHVEGGHATVATFDVSDPASPTVDQATALVSEDLVFNDLALTGDDLWITAFTDGLLHAPLDAAGQPAEPTSAAIPGDALEVDGDGDTLAVIGLDQGLTLADVSTLPATVTATVPLEGPPLGVDLRGDRVAVALGSRGARVWRHLPGAAPELEFTLQPQCVANSVALAPSWIAVGCTSGVTVYDLSGAEPRVAGFTRANYVAMDVQAPTDDVLVASDWHEVVAWQVDAGGHAVLVDAEHSRFVTGGFDACVVVRNPGDIALTVTGRILEAGGLSETVTVQPQSTAELVVPASHLDEVLDSPFFQAELLLTTREAGHIVSLADDPPCTATQQPGVRVLLTRPRDGLETRPVIGEPSPVLELGTGTPGADDAGTLTTPAVGERTRVMLYTNDCSAAWPRLQDLAWLARHGGLPDDLESAVGVDYRGDGAPAADLWRLDGMTHAWATDDVGVLTSAAGGEQLLGTWVFDDGVGLYGDVIPGGADGNTDYVVDSDGVVESVERIYRGAWPLR